MIDRQESEEVVRYMEHKSIAYGADWKFGIERDLKKEVGRDVVGTCSFYDHEFRVWEYRN